MHLRGDVMRSLFEPIAVANLRLRNRFVMAPMTRRFSPGGAPAKDVSAYYRRRAEAGVALIISEGLEIAHPGSVSDPAIPNFFEADALSAWRSIVADVHAAGASFMPQLWHVGGARHYQPRTHRPEFGAVSPSGQYKAGERYGEPMTGRDIDDVICAYASAAADAYAMGCDGVELHAAHGYLIDQFFWNATNARADCYGGELAARTRFACEIVRECRRRTAPEFAIFLRFSQWKIQDYGARLADTPQQLAHFLEPLTDAGVDVFDCSTRKFWTPEFDGSDLTLAGWVKKLSGKPTMAVGSVGLDTDVVESLNGPADRVSAVTGLEHLEALLERGDFDLVGVGRALLADSRWVEKIRANDPLSITPYTAAALLTLT